MGNCLGRCLAGKTSLSDSTDEQEEELVQDNSRKSFIFKIMRFKRKKRTQFLEKFWERQDMSYSRLNRGNPVETSGIQLQCLDAQTLLLAARETLNNKYTNFRPESGMASSSRASSSLDLEWEHEYGNNSVAACQSWLVLPEEVLVDYRDNDDDDDDEERQSNHSMVNLCNGYKSVPKMEPIVSKPIARTSSRTSWSHISTPESLEWDVDEEQQKQLTVEDDSLDHETLALLHEIELLKKKVLNETGDGLGFGLPSEKES